MSGTSFLHQHAAKLNKLRISFYYDTETCVTYLIVDIGLVKNHNMGLLRVQRVSECVHSFAMHHIVNLCSARPTTFQCHNKRGRSCTEMRGASAASMATKALQHRSLGLAENNTTPSIVPHHLQQLVRLLLKE